MWLKKDSGNLRGIIMAPLGKVEIDALSEFLTPAEIEKFIQERQEADDYMKLDMQKRIAKHAEEEAMQAQAAA